MSRTTTRNHTVDLQQARRLAEHTRLIPEWQTGDNRFIRLCQRLHTTMDLQKTLQLFSEEMQDVVPFDSMSYSHRRGNQHFRHHEGKGGPHHCSYNLTLSGDALGTLRLNRRQRFTEDELMVVEQMIGILIQPLRNAWRFREALDASTTDSLTGLGNRRALDEALMKHTAMAERIDAPLSVMILDLDHFKAINDQYGHAFGDEVLARLGELLSEEVRACDECFRFGGEELVVILPQTSLAAAERVAERIRKAIRETRLICEGKLVKITASVGIATYESGQTPHDLLSLADQAMYHAKGSGRDQIVTERAV